MFPCGQDHTNIVMCLWQLVEAFSSVFLPLCAAGFSIGATICSVFFMKQMYSDENTIPDIAAAAATWLIPSLFGLVFSGIMDGPILSSMGISAIIGFCKVIVFWQDTRKKPTLIYVSLVYLFGSLNGFALIYRIVLWACSWCTATLCGVFTAAVALVIGDYAYFLALVTKYIIDPMKSFKMDELFGYSWSQQTVTCAIGAPCSFGFAVCALLSGQEMPFGSALLTILSLYLLWVLKSGALVPSLVTSAGITFLSDIREYFAFALALAESPVEVIRVTCVCMIGAAAAFWFGRAVDRILRNRRGNPFAGKTLPPLIFSVTCTLLLAPDGPVVLSVTTSALYGVCITLFHPLGGRHLVGLLISASYIGLTLVLTLLPVVIRRNGMCIFGAIATCSFGFAMREIVGNGRGNLFAVSVSLVTSVMYSLPLARLDGPFVPSLIISALVGPLTVSGGRRQVIAFFVSALYFGLTLFLAHLPDLLILTLTVTVLAQSLVQVNLTLTLVLTLSLSLIPTLTRPQRSHVVVTDIYFSCSVHTVW